MKHLLLTTSAAILLAGISQAAVINLNTGDSLGGSSFNTAGGWSNGQAPSAGNDYVNNLTGAFLRTPANGDSHTFAGDSLTIGPGATLLYKGTGNTGVLTVQELILNGGTLDARNGSQDVFQLAGFIDVAANSVVTAVQGPIVISSGISGVGDLTFLSSQTYATTTLSGESAITGDYVVNTAANGPLILDSFGSIAFTIGADGVNNALTTTTSGTVNLNGEFVFDLAGAATAQGAAWQIVSPSLVANYGETFAISDFVESMPDTWTSGSYEFSEATGVLRVIPEPTAALSLLAGVGMIALRRRR
ncbi:MAG: PEP-CTERM sorting domain-containing protein [Chthoniobacteraceae bacterium]